jgi:hypothetical protein
MPTLTRRRALGVLGSASAAMVAGCGSSATAPSTTATTTTAPGATNATGCVITPSETEGPYPDRTGMINNPA